MSNKILWIVGACVFATLTGCGAGNSNNSEIQNQNAIDLQENMTNAIMLTECGSFNGICAAQSSGAVYSNGSTGTNAYSVSPETKDVDLQQAEDQSADLNARAEAMAQRFGMSVRSALQLTELADRYKALSSGDMQVTAEDTAAVLDSVYAVAGVTNADVTAATQSMIQTGDQTQVNALLDQVANHLGMSSTAELRDEILPTVGITLPQGR